MAVQNSLARQDQSMKLSVYLQNDAVKKQINQVVGGKNGTRFISSIVSAVQSTPALQECTSPSIVNAALLGEALNLSPSPQLGQFYMVPFDNKKKGCKEAQFQLGYKGYIQLAIRSGYYKKLNVLAIKEGELVRYDPLDEEVEVNLIDDDILREEAPTMGYFAMFEYENGFRKTLYWSKKKMLAHAEKYSFAFYKNGGARSLELLEQGKIPEKDMWKYSSFWFKDFDGMALKTMLRQLISKWGIMSIDLQNAIITNLKEGSMEPKVLDINGNTYCNKNLTRYHYFPKADSLSVNTLTSIVDYIKGKPEELRETMILHVISPTEVRLYSGLVDERNREELMRADAIVNEFQFDRYYDQERFLIELQANFIESDDLTVLKQVAGNIESGTTANYDDDGVSQKTTIKSGIANKTDVIVPNPVKLRPYRTFAEIEQPQSSYVFRIQDSDRGPSFKLVEADGGLWKNATMKKIKEYLAYELAEELEKYNITIIA